MSEFDQVYYAEVAASFLRGSEALSPAPSLGGSRDLWDIDDNELIGMARDQGVELDRYKRKSVLPRVNAAIGVLKGLYPESVLDIGSQRGTFLWPCKEEFPWVRFTSLERDEDRFRQLKAVEEGGLPNLSVVHGDACSMGFDDGSFDCVTVLEVFEHLPDPILAAREAIRVAEKMVVASVPSRPDNNPEHIQLFTARTLEGMLLDAGARKVSISQVPSHFIAVCTL